jgi:hypothetical protein
MFLAGGLAWFSAPIGESLTKPLLSPIGPHWPETSAGDH